ncbi:MAG: iron-containing redox enzyme family protein [Rickettsiaceae bacterium]|nr:iron-containing redox enzyme family protein [Rickettsiaceae bacterium]
MNDLKKFLKTWDEKYLENIKKIKLFNTDLTSSWSLDQKRYFAKIFYHARGHFHDFLWFVGNNAEDKETKDIVLQNISEELNGSARSHEQMYFDFALSLGVDVSSEFVYESSYLDAVKRFNLNHIEFLYKHSADERFVALSAYERLDNVDYANLVNLTKSFGTKRKGLIFFKVHEKVHHFESTFNKLEEIWNKNITSVTNSFNFIANNQIMMWETLSEEVFNFK